MITIIGFKFFFFLIVFKLYFLSEFWVEWVMGQIREYEDSMLRTSIHFYWCLTEPISPGLFVLFSYSLKVISDWF